MNKKRQNLSKEQLANQAAYKQKRNAQLAELEDLQIKAAYWKAQFEIRDYTLKAEAIQPAYNEYMENEKKKNEELRKAYEEMAKKLKEQGVTAESLIPKEEDMKAVEVTQEMLNLNPQMAEEGLSIGDTIKVSKEPDLTEEEEEEALAELNDVIIGSKEGEQ